MGINEKRKDERTFGEAVAAARSEAGLTQIQLAHKLGLDNSTISKLERGRLRLSGKMARYVADYFARMDLSQGVITELRDFAPAATSTNSHEDLTLDLHAIQRKLQKGSPESQRFTLESLRDFYRILENYERARLYLRNRQWEMANAALAEGADQKRAVFSRLDLLFEQEFAVAEYNLGRFEEALVHALVVKSWLADPKLQAENHLLLGRIYRRLARWEDADKEITAAETLQKDDPNFVANCTRKRIALLEMQGRATDALQLVETAYHELPKDASQELFKLKRHHAWALSLIGEWEESLSKYDEADRDFSKLKTPMTEEDRRLEMARGMRYKADVLIQWPGRSPEALELYERALSLLGTIEEKQKTDIVLLRGMNLRGAGSARIEIDGMLREAQDPLEKSQQLFTRLDDRYGKYATYVDQGRLYAQLGDLSRSESYFQLALQGLAEIHSIYFFGACLTGLAETYYKQGIGGVQDAFDRLFELYHGIRNAHGEGNARLYNSLSNLHVSAIQSFAARAYLRRDRLQEGIGAFVESIGTGLAFNRFIFLARYRALRQAIDELQRSGRPQDAARLAERFLESTDVLVSRNRAERLEIDHARQEVSERLHEISVTSLARKDKP